LVISITIVLSALTLGSAFARAWSPNIAPNAHDRSVITYFKDHDYRYGYASINTALVSNYLSSWQVNLLPVGCDPDYILKKTTLFFDNSAFKISDQSKAGDLVPLILDGDHITIAPTTCTIEKIQQQLGVPQSADQLLDGSRVLIYKANQFNQLRSFD
jgi:hypothetical protein